MRSQEGAEFIKELLDIGVDRQIGRIDVALQIAVGAVVVTVVDQIDCHIAAAQLPLRILTRCPWAGAQEAAFLCCDV